MNKTDKIFVAGGRGLMGSAIVRQLKHQGFSNLMTPTSQQLDLTQQEATRKFFLEYKPNYVFVAAAKVGGIWANCHFPAEFCYNNLIIQCNIIQSAFEAGVKKLLFLGSSCIYPKDSPIPIKEEYLLKGTLEPTNEAYALAKITGLKMCEYYRTQYGADFISAMPCNAYGPNDNYDLKTAHMLPSLLHKFHVAKLNNQDSVVIWGTGKPRRELIYSDDVADACLFLMENYSGSMPINIGTGEDHTILEIAELVKSVTGFKGKIVHDTSQPDGVFQKVMDMSRLFNMGWRPKEALETGMQKSYEWFAERYTRALAQHRQDDSYYFKLEI